MLFLIKNYPTLKKENLQNKEQQKDLREKQQKIIKKRLVKKENLNLQFLGP